MGEHNTRLKVLDDNVKLMAEAQAGLRKDVDALTNSFDNQERLSQEVIGRLSALPAKKQPLSGGEGRGRFEDGEGSTSLGHHKPAPVQMARFSGENPDRWVLQAERYFAFYNIKHEDRVTISSFYFDDAASDWYDWMSNNNQLKGWPAFTKAVLQRFRQHELEELEGILAKLQQTSTVSEYRSRFEAITNRTMCLPSEFLTHCFISGLKAEFKHSVLIHKPNTLDGAMTLALLHEQRIALEKGLIRPTLGSGEPILPTPKSSFPNVQTSHFQSPNSQHSFNPTTVTVPSGSKIPLRCLTPSETAQRRAQGLCYHCDERYTWDHKCKAKPQLLLLEEDIEPTDSSDSPTPITPVELSTQSLEVPHSTISYNALAGGCHASTLRFQGSVNGRPVQVLLDGGSTHNFVQTRIANFLNLTITTTPQFSVLVGSGEKLLCTGMVQQVPLIIQGKEIKADFYVLPIQGWDMVLGVAWLSKLGPVMTDYGASVFEFKYNDEVVRWKGETSISIQPVQFNGLRRLHRQHAIAAYYHLELVPPDSPPAQHLSDDMIQLLTQFSDVFQKPQGLPPLRYCDHAIHLLP